MPQIPNKPVPMEIQKTWTPEQRADYHAYRMEYLRSGSDYCRNRLAIMIPITIAAIVLIVLSVLSLISCVAG